ncbi:outer membrane protein assembly factor BamB family protein [Halosegnis longus]
MPAHDAGLSNATTEAGPTESVEGLWSTATDGAASQPILVDETLYFGTTTGTLTALDGATGEERWTASPGDAVAAPWYASDQLYVPLDGELAAFSPDGTERWRVETPTRSGFVAASRGSYYVADSDTPTVVALNTDGEVRWRTDIADPWQPRLFATDDRVGISSGSRDSRYWTLDATTGDRLGEPPRPGNDFPTELCLRDGTMYAVEAFFGGIDATAATEAGHSWNAGVPGGADPSVSATADTLYYAVNGSDGPVVIAFDAETGTERWRRSLAGDIDGQVVAGTACVLVPTTETTVCLTRDGGSRLWRQPGLTAPLTLTDDIVFTTTSEGVRALRAR